MLRGPSSSAISLAIMASPGRRPFDVASPGSGDRTDEDSTNAIEPPRGGSWRADRAGQPDRPEEDRLERGPPGGVVDLVDPSRRRAADADQRAVQPSEAGHRGGHEPLGRGRVAVVRGDADRPVGAQLGRRGEHGVAVPSGHDDPRALGDQHPRGGQAQTRGWHR